MRSTSICSLSERLQSDLTGIRTVEWNGFGLIACQDAPARLHPAKKKTPAGGLYHTVSCRIRRLLFCCRATTTVFFLDSNRHR